MLETQQWYMLPVANIMVMAWQRQVPAIVRYYVTCTPVNLILQFAAGNELKWCHTPKWMITNGNFTSSFNESRSRLSIQCSIWYVLGSIINQATYIMHWRCRSRLPSHWCTCRFAVGLATDRGRYMLGCGTPHTHTRQPSPRPQYVSVVSVQRRLLLSGEMIYQDSAWGLILGLRPANERRLYFVTTSLSGWAQT